MAKYFEGKSYGSVKVSEANSFRDVVDRLSICPTLGITRAAFLKLGSKERNKVKKVPFLVAATFKSSPSERNYESALTCNLLFIDLDELPDGKCPAAPFFNDPDSLFTALQGLNFAAYITASSTPEKPRMRIMIDAHKIPITSYARAVATVGAMLGLTVNTESKVAVQPMFLPTQFSDSTDDDHPLIAHRTDARAFEMSDISEDLFPSYDDLKSLKGEMGIDALLFLRAPIPEITLAVAKEALDCIDPDVSYFDWLEIAAALKHQFSPDRADAAYELFDEWSSSGTKYGGEDETRAKWASLRPTPIGRVPITIRSLLRQAVAAGWDDKKVKDNVFNVVVRWLEETDSISVLIEKGVQKILAVPLLSNVQEDVLINLLCQQARKRFAHTITASAVRKDIARTKADIKAQEKPAEKMREPLWARGVCYVSQTQHFFRHRTGETYRVEAFNANYSRWLLPTEDSLQAAGIPVTPATLSKPIVSPADYALNHLKITTVYDYTYSPSQPLDVFFVERGRRLVNTYSPTYPELDMKNADAAGTLFQAHLSTLIAEESYRQTLIDFLAYLVQFPGRKIRWAPLVQSVEGAGKTFLAEAAKAVLGVEHVKMINGEAIKSGYNEWATGYQLVVLEEVRVAGTNRKEVMNALKPLITNDDIAINQKFRDMRMVPNISNYLLFSNHHDALALTPGDRRYFVIKSPLQNKSQVLALGEGYFPPLYALLRDQPGALRAFLDQWPISPDFRADGHAPRTRYVQDLINDSASDLSASVRRLLLEGDHPLIQYDIVSTKALMDVLRVEEGMMRLTAQGLGHALREEGLMQLGRYMIGEERQYLWIRSGVDPAAAATTAQKRNLLGVKNLHMELIFS